MSVVLPAPLAPSRPTTSPLVDDKVDIGHGDEATEVACQVVRLHEVRRAAHGCASRDLCPCRQRGDDDRVGQICRQRVGARPVRRRRAPIRATTRPRRQLRSGAGRAVAASAGSANRAPGKAAVSVCRGALEQRAAALQHEHKGGALGFVDVGGREEHGGAGCGLAGHEAPKLGAADRIDTGGGLVEDQQVGTVQDGHGEGELLAHAAGELPGQAVGCRRQPGGGEELGGACAQRGAAQPVGAAGKGQVLGGGQVVVHAGWRRTT